MKVTTKDKNSFKAFDLIITIEDENTLEQLYQVFNASDAKGEALGPALAKGAWGRISYPIFSALERRRNAL